jgi:hypothetical protein
VKEAMYANRGVLSLKMDQTNTSEELREELASLMKQRRIAQSRGEKAPR